MKIRFLLISVLILVTASIALAQPAQIRGTSASATFQYDDPNGCTVTVADVFVFHNEAYRDGDPIANASRIDIIYYEFGQPTGDPPSDPENCDGLYYFEIRDSDILSNDAFTASGGLNSAVLDTTITVFDEELFFDVNLDIYMEWTATGKPVNQTRPATATFAIAGQYPTPFTFVSSSAEISRIR